MGKISEQEKFELFLKLLDEDVDEREKIVKDADARGLLKPGLDGNRDLFAEHNEKMLRKFMEIVAL